MVHTHIIDILAAAAGILTFTYILIPSTGSDDDSCDGSDTSGYYGTGSCLAWMILMLSTVEFQIMGRGIARLHRGQSLIQRDDMQDLNVDATIVGAAAYPFLSTIGGLISPGLRLHLPHYFDERCDPSAAIGYMAWTLSVLALGIHYPLLKFVQRPQNQMMIQYSNKVQRQLQHRSLFFFLICRAASVSIVRNEVPIFTNFFRSLDLLSDICRYIGFLVSPAVLVGSVISGYQFYCHGIVSQRGRRKTIFFLALYVLRSFFWPILADDIRFEFAFPRSGHGLDEYDQLAALVAAFLAVLIPVFRAARRLDWVLDAVMQKLSNLWVRRNLVLSRLMQFNDRTFVLGRSLAVISGLLSDMDEGADSVGDEEAASVALRSSPLLGSEIKMSSSIV